MERRFYFPDLRPGEHYLEGREVHHIRTVLRARRGDSVILFDGRGHQARAIILEVGRRRVLLEVGEPVFREFFSPPFALHLGVCLPKESAWGVVLRSATELGVSSITPLFSERSRVYSSSQGGRLLERWRNILVDACKQCGRNTLPQLHLARRLLDFPRSPFVFFHPEFCVSGEFSFVCGLEELQVVIGPEGGFTDCEVIGLRDLGGVGVSLAGYILRVETAVVSALTFLMYRREFC